MKTSVSLLALALLCGSATDALAQSAGAAAPPRIRLAPEFVPGSVRRYQMEVRTATESRRSGLVEDPQAASQLEITWNVTVRIEVLPPDAAIPRRTRLRTTYEKSAATVRSDSFDPQAAAVGEQYEKLQGRIVEFALEPDGKVGDVKGLDEIVTDPQSARAARESLTQLASGAGAPKEEIAPGQTWNSERAATEAPLAGVVWRTESSYVRDEPCRLPAELAGSAGALAGETCAVIVTRFTVAQPRALRDPTPEEYRRRGLHTSGTWSGSGESLSYISRRTGWVVSVTQSATQEMDVTIATSDGQSSVRYAGRVRSQSHISLLPDATAPR